MRTILLLIASNVFMTMAWYGHLSFKKSPLWIVILASWLLALPEYALQVPANRWGHGQFTATQLKLFQEVISLSVFTVFALLYLRETPRWNEWLAMVLMIGVVLLTSLSTRRLEGRPTSSPADERVAAGEPRAATIHSGERSGTGND